MAIKPNPPLALKVVPGANQPAFSPISELLSEHRTIERILASLESMIAPANGLGSLDPGRARRTAQILGTFVDRYHHTREERGLFAVLHLRGAPSLRGPLSVVLCHHQEIAWHIRSLQQVALALGRSIRGAAEAYANHARGCIRFLRESIRREEDHLFPLAQQFFRDTPAAPLLEELCALEAHAVEPGAREACLRETTDLMRRPDLR